MSITYELREEAQGYGRYVYTPPQAEHLTDIADRIDAEHQKAMRELNNLADVSVLLPVDVEGVPIRVGDVVDVTPTDKSTGHMNVVVTSVIFKRSAALVTVDTADRPFTFWPNRIRHHHAPTVEDVLQKLLEQAVGYSDAHTTVALNAIAEYAARLELREEDA